jgi:ribosomal protein L29
VASIDADLVIQRLTQKLGEAMGREVIQQVYLEQLEKELTEANNELARERGTKAAGQADRSTAQE